MTEPLGHETSLSCVPNGTESAVGQDLAVFDTSGEDEPAELRGDDALFNALLAGAHVENAALAAHVSVRTAYRRLADPLFRQRLNSAREALRETIMATLGEAARDAVSRLWDLTSHDDPEIVLKASKVLLDSMVKIQNAQPRQSTTVEYSVKQSNEG